MRELNLNDHIGGVSGWNRPSPRQSKLRRRLITKKEAPITSALSSIKERESEALNTPPQIIIISPESTPDKLPTAPGGENLTEDVSLKEEEEEAALIKQINNKLGIQPSAAGAARFTQRCDPEAAHQKVAFQRSRQRFTQAHQSSTTRSEIWSY
ncbi:hypothetical protein XENOCAPTIV_018406 [Xenoophorus captivus]|uniref:Uncharacterized protein n=1 Tax=Xenoophorus captivus TaxID=1517983 RepID=A0ABV0R123_9TELE